MAKTLSPYEEMIDELERHPRLWLCRTKAVKKGYGCLSFCFDLIIRKGLGSILFLFLYPLVTFIELIVILIALPFESLWMPMPLVYFFGIFSVYLYVNILYHYRKASLTPAGRPPQRRFNENSIEKKIAFCNRCLTPKDEDTHHCSICDECVVHMDHHCIWLNNCVGAGNHRHFLQFTAYLSFSCVLYCIFTFSTFYDNYWHPTIKSVYCHRGLENHYFWIEAICAYGDEQISGAIYFGYYTCFMVSILVGCLFLWNCLLISNGYTYIRLLKNLQNIKLKSFLFPCVRPDFVSLWIEFLNLKHGRTFLRHILLPSDHRPTNPLNWSKFNYRQHNV